LNTGPIQVSHWKRVWSTEEGKENKNPMNRHQARKTRKNAAKAAKKAEKEAKKARQRAERDTREREKAARLAGVGQHNFGDAVMVQSQKLLTMFGQMWVT